jgi:hypothetical protein
MPTLKPRKLFKHPCSTQHIVVFSTVGMSDLWWEAIGRGSADMYHGCQCCTKPAWLVPVSGMVMLPAATCLNGLLHGLGPLLKHLQA